MPAINEGGHFLFTKVGTFGHLLKSIYENRRLKITASKNSLFLEVVALKSLPL
jgi:hypothetical protein